MILPPSRNSCHGRSTFVFLHFSPFTFKALEIKPPSPSLLLPSAASPWPAAAASRLREKVLSLHRAVPEPPTSPPTNRTSAAHEKDLRRPPTSGSSATHRRHAGPFRPRFRRSPPSRWSPCWSASAAALVRLGPPAGCGGGGGRRLCCRRYCWWATPTPSDPRPRPPKPPPLPLVLRSDPAADTE